MLFALWLIWISGTESGAAQVGAFNTLEACNRRRAYGRRRQRTKLLLSMHSDQVTRDG